MSSESKDPLASQRLAVEELASQLDVTVEAGEIERLVERIAKEAGAGEDTVQAVLIELRERGRRNKTWLGHIRTQIAQMGEATRRLVTSAFLGVQTGLIASLGAKFGDDYGLGSALQLLILAMAGFNTARSRRRELATLVGALFSVSYVVARAFFSTLLKPNDSFDGVQIILLSLLGALVGWLIWGMRKTILRIRFQADPEEYRRELLKQLIELQDELRVGERNLTFLAVDVVDSTGIKSQSDPLAAEYTFGEYARYVKDLAEQCDGQLHSAAGDGLIFVFEQPHQAFIAAKRILYGMIEFNAYMNRTPRPFNLRCGIHTGRVVTPVGNDPASVNYSHVLDVASHIEKAAPTGGIAISKQAAEMLPAHLLAHTESAISRDVELLLWKPAIDMASIQVITSKTPTPPQPQRHV